METTGVKEKVIVRNLRPEDLDAVILTDAKLTGRRREEFFKLKLQQNLVESGINVLQLMPITEFPFDGWGDGNDYDLVIFDKSFECVVAAGNRDPNGGFAAATWFGQHDIEFEGGTVEDLVNSYIATDKELQKGY